MMEFSVVIPVFNEQGSLALLQEELHAVMEKISSEYEIIYVNDGSKDSSLVTLKELKKEYPKIKIISFVTHAGQSTALIAGFKASNGKWIITLDSDLQNPPGEILELLKFKDKFDFITGIRKRRRDSFFKKTSSKVAMLLRWLTLGDITKDTGCSLKMFKREVVESLYLFRNFHRFFTYLVRQKGFSVKEVYVRHDHRKFGKSKYGTLERAMEGFLDLLGVFWLKKRKANYEIDPKC